MSRDTGTVNAYVTGFLGSKRIVLWDTMLQKLDADEAEFIMAHELGHYVLGHVVQGLLVSSALTFIGLGLARLLAEAALRRWGAPASASTGSPMWPRPRSS